MMNDKQLWDRAVEWVNENFPHLEGAQYDQKVMETVEEIEELDEVADWILKNDHVARYL